MYQGSLFSSVIAYQLVGGESDGLHVITVFVDGTQLETVIPWEAIQMILAFLRGELSA